MIRPFLFALAAAAVALAPGLAQDTRKAQPKKATLKPPQKREATPPADLATLPGFKVELVHTADPADEGSWICMCKDGQGRLVIAGQRSHPILRFTVAGGKVTKQEKLALPISEAMGLLYAFDSLYVNGAGPNGFGLYRCKESGDTGTFAEVKLLKKFDGAGEHGPHGLAVGPDNKLYVMNGNHTKLPEGLSPRSQYGNYREDLLLPRQWDGNGHAAGILAPGGYVVRTDPDGKEWELVLGGFRNAYDVAFNADGELFTFDSDMEWDWGMPWYRPTRVNHCVSAAEFGWRSGTGVWPEHYPGSLPATLNVGIGSPTGVGNAIGAKFPAKYQKAVYILDWTYGRLMAVHLTPNGASYSAMFENFVAPKGLDGKSPKKPLNVTDVVIGDDGAMYFTTGGRNTQAALYRVTYTGTESTLPGPLLNIVGAKERKLRRDLETFHGRQDPKAVAAAWKHLASPDRFLRYAARLAVESQPVREWKAKALAESDPRAALAGLLAVARCGEHKDQADVVARLVAMPLPALPNDLKLEKLRVLQVCFSRHGPPAGEATKKLTAELDAAFPGPNESVNREAAQLLIYLQSPKVLAKCLRLMAAAKTQEDRIHYLFHLRTLPVGFWTLDQRREYLAYWTKDRGKLGHPPELLRWFEEAGRGYADGNSFNNFFKNFLREYVSNLSAAELKELAPTIAAIDKSATETPQPRPRAVVKQWTADDLVPLLANADKGRNFEKGRQAYIDAQCAKCHRFSDFGGSVGPDLTAIASRFTRRDVLDSIIEPSKVVSEQYQNEQVTTLTGQTAIGRVVDESADTLAIQPDPLDAKRVVVKKANVESRRPAKLSPMPANLADVLTADEVLDLIAYLESAGRKQHPAFRK